MTIDDTRRTINKWKYYKRESMIIFTRETERDREDIKI